jgi:Siphovirus Gp157
MATKIKSPTLFDLSEELKLMIEDMEMWAEENEGDVTEYPMERIEKLEGDIKEKVLKCAVMYKEWKAQAVAIKSEEDALAKRRKAHQNKQENIKKYMESCLPPNAKFEDSRSSVAWKRNPPSVELLVPVESLPELFIRRAEPEADKTELKARMVEFEIPLKDTLGDPIFDSDGKPMTAIEYQVRWPKAKPEVDPDELPFANNPDEKIKSDSNYTVLARLIQNKSLIIK